MIQPSPAPKLPLRRVRPWLRWSLIGLAVVLVGLVVTVATYPRWAAGRAKRELVTRLEARVGGQVEVDRVTLDYDSVHVHGVKFGDQDGRVELSDVHVELDRNALWRGRIVPTYLEVRRGRVWGTRAGLEALGRRVRGASADDETTTSGQGRVRLRPDRLEVRGIRFDVSFSDGEQQLPVERVHGVARADWSGGHEPLKLGVRDVTATLRGGREAKVSAVDTTLPTDERQPLFPLVLEIEDASTAVTPQIAVGKVRGRVVVLDASASEIAVDLDGGFADDSGAGTGKLWSLEGKGRRDLTAGEVRVQMAAFELGRVPAVLERLPVVDSKKATVGGALELRFADGVVDANGKLELDGLNVRHELLARETVRDVGFGFDFAAQVDPAARRLVLEHATVRRGGVEMSAAGVFEHPREVEKRNYEARLAMPRSECQRVLDALPRELVPGLQGFSLGGTIDAKLELSVDFADLDALALTGEVGIDGCTVREAPPRAGANRLAGGFNHVVRMKNGGVRTVHLFSGSSDFTPLDWISPHVVSGVRTTEDAGFWRHNGFLPSQFEEALRRNLSAGRVRLGASTITMQMVKNVLLSHERTLSRKLQELFLTWYVERAVGKNRILEVYLNVIEYGPGVYGITNAARYYFGKHPSALNSLEAAYLTLMLPNPVGRHGMYCRNALTPNFDVKLRRIHGLMHSRGHIDAEEYLMWKDGDIVFDPRARGGESECLARSHVQMEATGTQIAVSGLLERGATDTVDDEPPPLMPIPRRLPTVRDDPREGLGEPLDPDVEPGLAPDPTPAMDELEALHQAERERAIRRQSGGVGDG